LIAPLTELQSQRPASLVRSDSIAALEKIVEVFLVRIRVDVFEVSVVFAITLRIAAWYRWGCSTSHFGRNESGSSWNYSIHVNIIILVCFTLEERIK